MSPASRLPRVVWWLFLADALLVLVHVLLHRSNTFFSLDHESNLPTIYQSLKYYSFAYLAFFNVWLARYLRISTRARVLFWGSLGGLLLVLGLDELGTLHESLEYFVGQSFPSVVRTVDGVGERLNYIGSHWVFYFLPFVLGFLVAAYFWVTYAARHYASRLKFLVAGFLLMLTIPVWEYVGSGGVGSWYPLFGAGEEYFEMMAITCLAAFVVYEARTLLAGLQKVRTRESGRE